MSGVLVCSGSWPSDDLRFGQNSQVPEIISRAYASAGFSRHAHVAVVTKGAFSLQKASQGHPFYMLELTSVSESIAQALTEAFHSPQLLDEDEQGICHCGIMWLPDEMLPSNIEAFDEPVYYEVRDSIIQLVVSGAAKLLESLRRCNARVLEQADTHKNKVICSSVGYVRWKQNSVRYAQRGHKMVQTTARHRLHSCSVLVP